MRSGTAVRACLWLLAAVTLLLIYGPHFTTVVHSFFSRRGGTTDWSSFTFGWYAKLLDNEGIRQALVNSLLVGFAAVAVALVLGLVLAF